MLQLFEACLRQYKFWLQIGEISYLITKPLTV